MNKLVFLCTTLLFAACNEQNPHQSLEQSTPASPFHRLAGHWVKDGQFARVAESWSMLVDGSFEGSVYRIEQNDSSLLEALRIHQKDSTYIYTAVVSGQNNDQPVDFELFATAGDSSFVFVNPSHDFPQRIVYRFRGADSLHITLGLFHSDIDDKHFHFVRLKAGI